MCGDAAVDWRMRGHAGQSWMDERKYFILEDELRQEEGRDDEVRTGGKVRISPRSAGLPTSQRGEYSSAAAQEKVHTGVTLTPVLEDIEKRARKCFLRVAEFTSDQLGWVDESEKAGLRDRRCTTMLGM